MEYFARRPHRRKHPTSNGISWKNPYEDVVLSNGGGRGKGKVFDARDYAEIFAGSSSIPVFDLSGLDERVESGGCQSSKVDYGDVFGRLRNDDVGVPYEELFNASSVKESSPRVSTGVHSRTSSMKSETTSGEVPDQGKQFAMSPTESPQRYGDASNEKKQQGSPYFFNGTSLKTPDGRPQSSLKHEVSRTWSFSAEVEAVKNKGSDLARLHDTNEASNALPTSSLPFIVPENSVKVPEETKVSSDLKGDDSEKPGSDCWPFSFGEEFDENSPAALSAAALKKAIDQARESIRIAKMIMERRKQGHREGSNRRQKAHQTDNKFLDKASGSFECKFTNKDVKSDIVFTPHDGKFSSSIDHSDAENSGLKKHAKNVEAKAAIFAGLEANEECGTATLVPEKVDDGNSETILASRLERPETSDENLGFREVTDHTVKEPEVVETEKMSEEVEQPHTTCIQLQDSDKKFELVESVHCSYGDVANREDANLNTNPEVEVINEGENYTNDNDAEYLRVLTSKFENLLVQPCNPVGNEMPEQKEIVYPHESVSEDANDVQEEVLAKRANDEDQDIEEVIWDEPVQPEMDSKKQEPDQNDILETKFDDFICKVDEAEVIDSNDGSEVYRSSVIWDAVETDYILHFDSEKAEYAELSDETVGDTSVVSGQIQETCDVESLHQSNSGEILVESEVNHGLDELSSDEKKMDDLVMEADLDEKDDLPSSQARIEHLDVEDFRNLPEQRSEGSENVVSTEKENEAKENFDRTDQQQRIEAIRKGREREKDRQAVERAIREARERALAEARERAERAAVERASIEVRMRCLAEAQEKLEKAAAAKLRAERAAVERATVEARLRALEKAKSQKASPEVRSHGENSTGSYRNEGLKHSFSSSDLETASQTESAQRRKARLERHQRIMERAAKALEEKNRRDLLVLKEQAERNRIAEYLDADIKRWSAGKEGNLRALLSTLHYILSSDSGWQPISLTEIITTAAVKKAYRKATLCVHPDKLQQRGASIQHKYKCEKVFDLLKAAWNRFNSEER